MDYIEKWLTINDQDDFTGSLYFILREMSTVIKNQCAGQTTALYELRT